MPVTAKLSRNFYEKLGDDVANELVEWFNQVDAEYKADLKELADLYYGRFRAELRAELAAARAEIVKWMFLFWAPTALALVGLLVGLYVRG
jgi:hypothetical protein